MQRSAKCPFPPRFTDQYSVPTYNFAIHTVCTNDIVIIYYITSYIYFNAVRHFILIRHYHYNNNKIKSESICSEPERMVTVMTNTRRNFNNNVK